MSQSFNTGFHIPKPDKQGGAFIKSIQRGNTTTTGDITISPIDINKSIVIISPYYVASSFAQASVSAELTSPTNLKLYRTVTSSTTKVGWQVIEYYNVKSKQTGTTAVVAGVPSNVTVSPVNMNKALLIVSFDGTDNANNYSLSMNYAYLSDVNNIYIETARNMNCKWQLIEFF